MKKIPGYPRQSLTEDGRLYRDGEEVETFIDKNGYRAAWIYRGRKKLRHPKKIYQLMAKTYLGPKPFPKAVVRHLDGDCHNDSVENLEWGSHAENMEDLRKHRESRTPLTNDLKEQIRQEIVKDRPFIDHDDRVNTLLMIADKYDVAFTTVNRIYWKIYG